jgi:hypothetical protein
MNNRRLHLFLLILWLGTLSCTTLFGTTPTPLPTLEPTPVPATPTLSQALIVVTPTNTQAPIVVPTRRPTPTDTPEAGSVSVAEASCPAGGQNLLVNPSFEQPFNFQAGQEILVAQGWTAWWLQGSDANFRPEFKPTDLSSRVHSGSSAQQYFKTFGQYLAGMRQFVDNAAITPGARVQFSAWGMGWSCIQGADCSQGISQDPADMLMRVGIDTTGNTDPNAGTVKWSDYFNPIDQYQIQCVEAVAESSQIVVFTWSSPDQPRLNQDTYWDDGALVILP